LLSNRLQLLSDQPEGDDAVALWSRLGIPDATQVNDLDVDALRALRPA
jgi:malonate decarboxylase beta subunit